MDYFNAFRHISEKHKPGNVQNYAFLRAHMGTHFDWIEKTSTYTIIDIVPELNNVKEENRNAD